jgi:hypothetical protein
VAGDLARHDGKLLPVVADQNREHGGHLGSMLWSIFSSILIIFWKIVMISSKKNIVIIFVLKLLFLCPLQEGEHF